jgi:hypothetical protein
MFPEMCDSEPDEHPQRVTVVVDLVPGPFTPDVASRMLHVLTHELLELGADVTSVRLEITGPMASW